MHVRISLVLPAYNEEHFIAACLDSVASQTEPPDEVILVDNNSTDKTVAIAKHYPFVKILHEKRQGLRYTRNTGMDAATGDVIGRIDADCVLNPSWCAELRRMFADPTVNAATGSSYYYDQPMPRFNWQVDRFFRRLAFIGSGPLLYGSNMAMRREVWQRIRPEVCMEGEFFEDYDLSIHILKAGYRITYNPKLVVGVATRILDNSPRVFMQTMQHHMGTFRMHGLKSGTARKAQYTYYVAYPIGRIAKRTFNPTTGKASLRQAIRRHKKTQTLRPTSNT